MDTERAEQSIAVRFLGLQEDDPAKAIRRPEPCLGLFTTGSYPSEETSVSRERDSCHRHHLHWRVRVLAE